MLIDATIAGDKLLLNTDFIDRVYTIQDEVTVVLAGEAYKTKVTIERLKEIVGYNKFNSPREGCE